MPTSTRVLLVADGGQGPARAQLLRATGYRVEHAQAIGEAVGRLASTDVVVLDHVMGGLQALELLLAAPGALQVAIVVLMRDDDAAEAQATLRRGCCDVVLGSAGEAALPVAIERALREARLRSELTFLRTRADVRNALVGRSSAMTHVRELVARAAASRATMLVVGEPGTGKGVVARMVHDLSERAAEPFVMVESAGTDTGALELRLFGRAGPSDTALAGALERAAGGTLVLDDATAMVPALQMKLARAVATRSTQRAGAREPTPADVRLVLVSRVAAGGGRSEAHEDLIARFNAMPIVLPPLRERRSDIPQLVQHFRSRVAAADGVEICPLGPEALLPLLGHDWSGNVRELEQWVERSTLSTAARLPDGEGPAAPSDLAGLDLGTARVTLEQLERAYILHVLDQESGHQSRAAVRLGIDRRTLYRKLKQYRREQPDLQQAG